MFNYYLNRGLDCVEVIAKNLSERTWLLPDLLCPDVIDTIKANVKAVEFYHVGENLDWAIKIAELHPKVLFSVDYFGQENPSSDTAPPNTIIVRDSVWFPMPFSPVKHHEIWFNSWRKIYHAVKGIKGAFIISPYRLSGMDSIPNIANHHALTWWEMNKRWENYYFCKEIFKEFAISHHNQQFPSVFPIKLNNRDEILAELDTPLPRMWVDLHNLGNVLYNKLAFIPLDSRYTRESLAKLASRISELAKNESLL